MGIVRAFSVFIMLFLVVKMDAQVFQSTEFSSIVLWNPDHLVYNSREMIEFSLEEVTLLEDKLLDRVEDLERKSETILSDSLYTELIEKKIAAIVDEIDELYEFKKGWMAKKVENQLLDSMVTLIKNEKCFLVKTADGVCHSNDVIVADDFLTIDDEVFIEIPVKDAQKEKISKKMIKKDCDQPNPEDCIKTFEVDVLKSFRVKNQRGENITLNACPLDFEMDKKFKKCVLTIPESSWENFNSVRFMNCDFEFTKPLEIVVVSCEE